MRKLIWVYSFIIPFLVLFISSCGDNFVMDPLDPRLPKYSEEGKNTAGAYFNNSVWKSDVSYRFNWIENRPYIYSYPNGDSLLITFEGDKGYITFKFNNISVRSINDFKGLSGRKFYFDNGNEARLWNSYGEDFICKSTQIGQIYLRSISQKTESSSIIVSGTFGFKPDEDSAQLIDVTYGRFDYRFSWGDNILIVTN